MHRFSLVFSLLYFVTQVLSASAIAQGTDDKGKSDRTSKKLESTSSISITADVESKVDGQEQGEGSAASKGQVTIEINGEKHQFSFEPNAENMNRTFRKVIKDGKNSIAVIEGSFDSLGINAESIEKMIQDAGGSLPDAEKIAGAFEDLPEEVRKQMEKMFEQLPDSEAMKKRMFRGWGQLGRIPSVKIEGFSTDGLDSLSEEIRKQVEKSIADAKRMAAGDGVGGAKTTVRIFQMKDGKMIPMDTESGEKAKDENSDATTAALKSKVDLLLKKIEDLEAEVKRLKNEK